jgi:hypothetical protein
VKVVVLQIEAEHPAPFVVPLFVNDVKLFVSFPVVFIGFVVQFVENPLFEGFATHDVGNLNLPGAYLRCHLFVSSCVVEVFMNDSVLVVKTNSHGGGIQICPLIPTVPDFAVAIIPTEPFISTEGDSRKPVIFPKGQDSLIREQNENKRASALIRQEESLSNHNKVTD